MAKAAERQDNEEIQKPDFERGLRIMRGDLNPLTEESAKVRGDQAAAWKSIEKDCHLNKGGAKYFLKLLRKDPELRDDELRTLYGLMKEAGIGIRRDMIDDANGNDTDMPTAKQPKPDLVTVQ